MREGERSCPRTWRPLSEPTCARREWTARSCTRAQKERMQIRVHDLRGTFVTLALANGKSESWISDRTGHRSSQMIARYKRNARTFAELHLGTLAALNAAIPELAIAHGLPTEGSTRDERPHESINE